MVTRILQTNLNHASQAQHLMTQCLAERGLGLAIVAEPYRIPEDNPTWVGDTGGAAALVRAAIDLSPLSRPSREGRATPRRGGGHTTSFRVTPPRGGIPANSIRSCSAWG